MANIEIPRITGVPIPMELDMRNARSVINFLSEIITECVADQPTYYGAILYGSLSRGTAHNGSDVDLIHIAADSSWQYSSRVHHKLQVIGDLYDPRLRIDRSITPWSLDRIRLAREEQLKEMLFLLDSASQALIPNPAIREEVERLLKHSKKPSDTRIKPGERVMQPLILRMDSVRTIEGLPSWHAFFEDLP